MLQIHRGTGRLSWFFAFSVVLLGACVSRDKAQMCSEVMIPKGAVYQGERVVLFPVYGLDRDAMEEEVNFHVTVPQDIPLKEKLEKLCEALRRFRFNHLPISVDAVDVRDGCRVAIIHLREDPSESWRNGHFQGSTGGHLTSLTLTKTLLQPDYDGDWIDCVEFYYEGEPIAANRWDHIWMNGGTFCREGK